MLRLPKFKGWTIDYRLRELRNVEHDKGIQFVAFDSSEGKRVLREMEANQRRVSAAARKDTNRCVVIISLCRSDLASAELEPMLTDEQIESLTDEELAEIAERMGDDYVASGQFWNALDFWARTILDNKK